MSDTTGRRFDAIVVGSGFGGAVNAARLAEAGLRVLVLERGPWWGPGHADRPSVDWRPYPRGLLGSRKFLRGVRWARNGRRVERVLNTDGFLEIHRFDRLLTVTSNGVGGGSHHYTSIMEEPPAEFFGAYPPEITGPEMHPYFERVRAMLRPSPAPRWPEKDDVFEEAVAQAGLPAPERPDLAVAWDDASQRPRTVTDAAGASQHTSTYRSWAFVGSDDGSNTTLDVTYVPLAQAHGAELRPFCEVIGIGANDGGYEVHYVDHRTGGTLTEHAPRLVLAAGCLNTLRLLFAARDHDRTLTGVSGMLGRRFSVNGDRLSLVWRSRILQDSSWGPPISAMSNISRGGRHRFAVGVVGLPVHAMPVPSALAGWIRASIFVFTMGRDAPVGTVGFDGRGVVTSANRSLDPDLYDEMEDVAARIAEHYQARRVLPRRRAGREGLVAVHPMGGCAMGRSAEEGVVDHRGEVFGHPGLYIADGSLYPRSPGVAPSMTIAALAERQAELITA